MSTSPTDRACRPVNILPSARGNKRVDVDGTRPAYVLDELQVNVVDHGLQIRPLLRGHFTVRTAHVFEFARLNYFHVNTNLAQELIIMRKAHDRADAAGYRARIGENLESGRGYVIPARRGKVAHAYHEGLIDFAEFHDFFENFLRWGHGPARRVDPKQYAGYGVVLAQIAQLLDIVFGGINDVDYLDQTDLVR